ncbi:MAG TPA: response regulator [Actinomycetota bacterium]|nr:response regulator [Actinomycetota bacterium]
MSVDAVAVRVFAIVEDDADSRMVVRTLFSEDPRFSVAAEAESAEDAIVMARTEEPDLIVLDHNLDGPLTGLEAAPLLKQEAPGAKIILFTGDDEIRRKALEEDSVDAYLPKSRPDELVPTACRLLGLH